VYIQQVAPSDMKGFAQGLMMFMSNGVGATFGTIAAGSIVNHWCHWKLIGVSASGGPMRLFMGDWIYPWCIFAAYSLAVLILWLFLFKPHIRNNVK
ncbi:MAG: hypothetical protein K2J48_11180, partial [Muribaculaceae bacterium]|nr:hypothetical protein [Muribaculaceae bacterium]